MTRRPWLVGVGLAAPVAYASLNLAASVQGALVEPRLTPREAAQLPLVYATMHGAWGLGFLRGLPRSERKDG